MTKAEQAQLIFAEVNGVRADFIKRVMEELSMSKPGASTYFQNCKTRAAGEKVKYYSKKAEKSTVDDSSDDVPESFEVELLDGTIKCFLSQAARNEFVEQNPSLIAEQAA